MPAPDSDARNAEATLPDLLAPGLDLVLCGCNPGLHSAAVGHYFAHPGNAFWRLLAEAGITPGLFRPEEDRLLLTLGIGLTDVVPRASAGIDDVRPGEWQAGARALAGRLLRYRPAAVCFVGAAGYRAFAGRQQARWGRQPEDWEGVAVFVVPSPSGRAARLGEVRRAAYREVGEWLRERRQQAGERV
jgi:TDG/mug DNA glycosylase family protein